MSVLTCIMQWYKQFIVVLHFGWKNFEAFWFIFPEKGSPFVAFILAHS